MLQQETVADRIPEAVRRAPGCQLDDLVLSLSGVTWNQVFLEVDRMSRTERVCVTSVGEGTYKVELSHAPRGGKPTRLKPSSEPVNLQEEGRDPGKLPKTVRAITGLLEKMKLHLTWTFPLLRVAGLLTILAGLVAIDVAAPALAESRRAAEAEARKHGAPMVWVSDGTFIMGSPTGSKVQPSHEVYLHAFYIDKYEVTAARYAKFLSATGHNQPWLVPMLWEQVNLPYDGDRPVIGVTWRAAEAFCRWVGKRLPTEAEWEKAARGTDGRTYPWGDADPTFTLANYNKLVTRHTYSDSLRPVGSYETGQSPYGIYDMAGNASEWVADWYDEKYYAASPKSNPKGPASGDQKVLRGGSFRASPTALNSTTRESYSAVDKVLYAGIRCAQDAF